MQHLEGSGMPVLYVGRMVQKVKDDAGHRNGSIFKGPTVSRNVKRNKTRYRYTQIMIQSNFF
jgi:hypothetical protein